MRGFRKGRQENDMMNAYLEDDPWGSWKDGFYESLTKTERDALKSEIFQDQAGLCAYCEKELIKEGVNKPLGYKVEHFIPENSKHIKECIAEGHHGPFINYSLRWTNLFGCCYGGEEPNSASYVQGLSAKAENSCDVPKSHYNWYGLILDPSRDLPIDQTYFEFDEDGVVLVAEECPDVKRLIASQTIQKLNLNCNRLVKLRLATLEKLSTLAGEEDSELLIEKDENGLYGEFISLRKWYLAY